VRLSEAPSYGQTILTYAPQSAGALAYRALAQELLARETRLEAGS
jgi:chromosome partitioning protein